MRVAIQQSEVRFGKVLQCGRDRVYVAAYDSGRSFFLHMSHLRRIESGSGEERMFATGETKEVHLRDEVVFVPREHGFWYWGFLSDYILAGMMKAKASGVEPAPPDCVPVSPPALPPGVEINLEELGNERVAAFRRRYPGYNGGARQVV